MSNVPDALNTHAQLRHKAEIRIQGGTAPGTLGWTLGASSLTLLHRLSSDPTTASDALKLLHELQVHQVELDLQQEHMIEETQALAQSANQLAELYIYAPVAYFVVNTSGDIAEGNFVGARLLGVERGDVSSQNMVRLAAPYSRPALLELLEQVQRSGLRHSCRVQALDTARDRWLEVIASASPAGHHCLVVVAEVSDMPLPSLTI